MLTEAEERKRSSRPRSIALTLLLLVPGSKKDERLMSMYAERCCRDADLGRKIIPSGCQGGPARAGVGVAMVEDSTILLGTWCLATAFFSSTLLPPLSSLHPHAHMSLCISSM